MYGAQEITTLAKWTVPPSEENSGYGYALPVAGFKVSRFPRLFQPLDQSYSFPIGNGIVRIRLPNDGAYDFRESMLLVDVTLTNTPALVDPYLALMSGAWNLFDRFRLLQQGNVIQERNDYAKCYNLTFILQADPDYISGIGQLLGVDILANRITNALAIHRYSIPLDTGILTQGNIPLNVLAGAIDVELYMSLPADCLDTNGTANQITLNNIEWYVDRIAGAEYETKLAGIYQAGLRIAFKEMILFQNPVIQIAHDLKIGVRRASIDTILSYFTNNDAIRNTDVVASGFMNRQWNWQKLSLRTFQFRINGTVFPDQAVDCTGRAIRAYHMMLKLTNSWKIDGLCQDSPNIEPDAFNGPDATHGQFLITGDFRANCRVPYWEQNVINLLGTEANSQDVQLNIRLDAPPPASSTIFHFTRYSCISHVHRDGTISTHF